MSTKHIYNSPEGLVIKSLRGAVALNPSLRLHAASKSVYNANPSPTTRVAVISGGGAGHEPAHASYTGNGMLAASVSGDIFASPSAKQILTTIQLAMFAGKTSQSSETKDVLVIINNYTGDRLNFGLAIESAQAIFRGSRIESVVVADDVSLLTSSGLVGPRGLAGNILVCKILGALAERGATLENVKAFGDAVVSNLASIGVGLEHCHVPGRDAPATSLGPRECELGLGLHNEPGVQRKVMRDAEELVREMLTMVLRSKDKEGSDDTFVQLSEAGIRDDTVLFLNNLGGMSQLELGAILDECLVQLAHYGIYPARICSSSYMTSLNAPGFSISILNSAAVFRAVQGTVNTIVQAPADVLALVDGATDAAAWIGVRSHWPTQVHRDMGREETEVEQLLISLQSTQQCMTAGRDNDLNSWEAEGISRAALDGALRGACTAVLDREKELTQFDTIVGDGDCGETFAKGATAVLNMLGDGQFDVMKLSPASLIQEVSRALEDSMGGTIGALFAIFLTAVSASLTDSSSTSWPKALNDGLVALSKHTPAQRGDRTLLDALAPFCFTLAEGKTLHDAARAAWDGANSTKGMLPTLGRAAYMRNTGLASELPPDPGAWGVAAIVEGFCEGFYGVSP